MYNMLWQQLPSQRKQINISHTKGCQAYHRHINLTLLPRTPPQTAA